MANNRLNLLNQLKEALEKAKSLNREIEYWIDEARVLAIKGDHIDAEDARGIVAEFQRELELTFVNCQAIATIIKDSK